MKFSFWFEKACLFFSTFILHGMSVTRSGIMLEQDLVLWRACRIHIKRERQSGFHSWHIRRVSWKVENPVGNRSTHLTSNAPMQKNFNGTMGGKSNPNIDALHITGHTGLYWRRPNRFLSDQHSWKVRYCLHRTQNNFFVSLKTICCGMVMFWLFDKNIFWLTTYMG